MRSIRLLVALLLLACAVAALVFLTRSPVDVGGGTFQVEVVGRDGNQLFAGPVEVEEATALGLLRASALAAGFDVEVRGRGCNAYVASVAGQAEDGRAGWVFHLKDREGQWVAPGESAGCCALRQGDVVQWVWSEEGTLGPPCDAIPR